MPSPYNVSQFITKRRGYYVNIRRVSKLNIYGGELMKKRVLFILLAMVMVVSAVSFAACGGEEEPTPAPPPPTTPTAPTTPTEPPPPPPPPPFEWPDLIKVTCGTGVGVASTTGYMAEMSKDTGMKVRIVPEGNLSLAARWLNEGRFFQWSQAPSALTDILEAIKGNAWRDGGPFQIRQMWAHSRSNSGFMVRGDSDIRTIYDIKPGVKIVNMTFIPGMKEGHPYALLAWAGVNPEDVEWWPGGSFGACVRAISGGQADILFSFPTSPTVFEAEAAPHGLHWIPMPAKEDPEGAARYLAVEPAVQFFPVPPGGGVESSIGVPMMGSASAIHVRADADTELVYNMAKWFDTKYDLYKDNHAWNKWMTIDTVMELVESYFVPAHDGLVKYLEEKGLWTPAHEARQQQNIEFLTRYVDAYQTAINMADEQGIAVDPENDEWIQLWVDYKEELNLPVFRMFVGLD